MSELPPRNDPLGEALLPFEGSGIDTHWGLELDTVANPHGRNKLGDVVLSFEITAEFSAELRAKHRAAFPTSVQRMVFLSAQTVDNAALAPLRDGKGAEITFNAQSCLVRGEFNATIHNVMIFLISEGPLPAVALTMRVSTMATPIPLKVTGGVELSNVPITPGEPPPTPPSALNVVVGGDVAQTFSLTIRPEDNNNVSLATITDVVLGLDYSSYLYPGIVISPPPGGSPE